MKYSFQFLCITTLFINSCIVANCTPSDVLETSCSVAECMNGGNSDFSTAILCNVCLRKALSNGGANASLFHDVKHKVENDRSSDHTNAWKIIDKLSANINVLNLIADQLEINDVLSLFEAHSSKRFSGIVNEMFRNKYKGHIVHINGRFDIDEVKFEENTNRIVVCRKAPIFLRAFGSVIEHLEVEHPSTITLQCINKYLSDSLTKLELNGISENAFKYFKKPFRELVDLSLHSSVTVGNGHLPLNQLYPKLRTLELYANSNMNKSAVAVAFPYLEHVKLNVKYSKNDETQTLLEVIIENPHIRSLAIDHLSQDFCKVINEHVAKLEHLTVHFVPNCDLGNEIRFEHVKNLKIGRHSGSFERFSLPSLRSLEIYYKDILLNKWTNFVGKHQNITCLKVKDAVVYGKEMTLTELIHGLPNLVEFSVEHLKNGIKTDIFDELIERNAKLERIDCISCCFSKEDIKRLREKLEKNWNLFVRPRVDQKIDLLFEKNLE